METTEAETMNGTENVQASSDMCVHAFNILLKRLRPNEYEDFRKEELSISDGMGGVFVTWSITPKNTTTETSSNYSLRGCIGTLKPNTQIKESLTRYTIHSAFHDHRFDAIHASELERLKVGVSILSNFEVAKSIYDWDVGKHGIILDIDQDDYGSKSATYLPEVCADHKWSKDYCLQSLAEKAGYSGNIKSLSSQQTTLTKYQSSRVEMSYQQYLEIVSK